MQKEKQINEKVTNVEATRQILNKVLDKKERQALGFMVDKILNAVPKNDNLDKKGQIAIKKILSLNLAPEIEKEMIEKIQKQIKEKKNKVNNGLGAEVIDKARWVLSQLSVIKKALAD